MRNCYVNLTLILASILLATSGVQAGVYVTLTDPDNQRFYIDIPDNAPVAINVMMDNDAGEYVTAISNGIRIYSPTGATWQTPTYAAGPELATYFDGGVSVYGASVDGTNDDTVVVMAFAAMQPGVPNGYDDVILTVQTMMNFSTDGDTLCIDSAFYPPGGYWQWVTPSGTVTPSWGGPYCYEVVLAASISGTKFHDENGNSIWEPGLGEGVLDDVTINLHGSLDAGGTVDLSTVTDAQGDYLFSGLTPGDYFVVEEVKSWWAA